jgi:hypothetical protein
MTRHRTLDVGCGNDKLPNAIGMDIDPQSAADVIHDMDVLPWPFEDSTFEFVRAQDVLEHVNDFVGCMEELHRICAHGAFVDVRMPFTNGPASDPPGKRSATSETFNGFDPNRPLDMHSNARARFELVRMQYECGYPATLLGRARLELDRKLLPIAHRHTVQYEHFFTRIYPMHKVQFLLRVFK